VLKGARSLIVTHTRNDDSRMHENRKRYSEDIAYSEGITEVSIRIYINTYLWMYL
jgi:hypothetical protein